MCRICEVVWNSRASFISTRDVRWWLYWYAYDGITTGRWNRIVVFAVSLPVIERSGCVHAVFCASPLRLFRLFSIVF